MATGENRAGHVLAGLDTAGDTGGCADRHGGDCPPCVGVVMMAESLGVFGSANLFDAATTANVPTPPTTTFTESFENGQTPGDILSHNSANQASSNFTPGAAFDGARSETYALGVFDGSSAPCASTVLAGNDLSVEPARFRALNLHPAGRKFCSLHVRLMQRCRQRSKSRVTACSMTYRCLPSFWSIPTPSPTIRTTTVSAHGKRSGRWAPKVTGGSSRSLPTRRPVRPRSCATTT